MKETSLTASSPTSEGRNRARRGWDELIKKRKRTGMPLALVPPGTEGKIVEIRGGRGLVKRLSDLGFTQGTKVRVVHTHNPGPVLVEVKDSRIALGRGVSMKIIVMEEA